MVSGSMDIIAYELADNLLSGSITASMVNPDDDTDVIDLQITFENVDFRMPVEAGNMLTADLDGTSLSSTNVSAYSLGFISIRATMDNGMEIAFITSTSLPEGQHNIELGSPHVSLATVQDATGDNFELYFGDEGTFTVTKHDKDAREIEAYFEFEAPNLEETETKYVTNGDLSIRY
jgi:hypothetical protein